MPTTLPLLFRGANAGAVQAGSPTTANADLFAVVAFATIGLLLTIGSAIFLPLPTDIAALALSIN